MKASLSSLFRIAVNNFDWNLFCYFVNWFYRLSWIGSSLHLPEIPLWNLKIICRFLQFFKFQCFNHINHLALDLLKFHFIWDFYVLCFNINIFLNQNYLLNICISCKCILRAFNISFYFLLACNWQCWLEWQCKIFLLVINLIKDFILIKLIRIFLIVHNFSVLEKSFQTLIVLKHSLNIYILFCSICSLGSSYRLELQSFFLLSVL